MASWCNYSCIEKNEWVTYNLTTNEPPLDCKKCVPLTIIINWNIPLFAGYVHVAGAYIINAMYMCVCHYGNATGTCMCHCHYMGVTLLDRFGERTGSYTWTMLTFISPVAVYTTAHKRIFIYPVDKQLKFNINKQQSNYGIIIIAIQCKVNA